MGDVILETRGLTKVFNGFTAVDHVDLQVQQGHIHALIGPNGAGKSTFFNLLTRFLTPTAGAILYQGRGITSLNSSLIARQGLVRSFQISAVFAHMSVLENVRIALQRVEGNSFHFWIPAKRLDRLNERAMQLLEQVGLRQYDNVLAVELPYGRKRALELATTLALEPTVMLLDEPTQGMGSEDVDAVVDLIRRVSAGR